jgi:hypothetical protein
VGPPAAVRAGDALLSSRVSELWRECVARLDDDEPRHILADALQSEDDPRGELMMLQLMPADPDSAPARRARIRELVGKHRGDWLGELVHIATGASWDRGFLTRLELRVSDRDEWRQPGSHDRELATLQEVMPPQLMMGSGPRARDATFRAVIADPRVVSLRAFEGNSEVLPQLAQPIRHLAIDAYEIAQPRAVMAILDYLENHAHVRSIAFPLVFLPTVRAQSWFERLEVITIGTTIRRGMMVLDQLPSPATIVLGTRIHLDSCDLRSPFDARLELDPNHTARVAGEWMLTPLEVLAELPARITRLEIEDTSEAIGERIRATVGSRIEIALRGLVGRAANVRWKESP